MVIEMTHNFSEPVFRGTSQFSDPIDAGIALLSLGIEALCFPATFHCNLHFYGPILYNIWRLLNNDEFAVMMRGGFTLLDNDVCSLTRDDIRDGRIPRVFIQNAGQIPTTLRRFINAIRPVGERVHCPSRLQSWSSNLNDNDTIYIPFLRRERDPRNELQNTPFGDRLSEIINIIRDLVSGYVTRWKLSKPESASLMKFLTSLAIICDKFGGTCHYEMNIIHNAVFRGPEIPLSQYDGEQYAARYNRVGLSSSQFPNLNGLPAYDCPIWTMGIGLYMLFAIIPNVTASERTLKDFVFHFPNPIDQFRDYSQLVQNMTDFTEAFGILSQVVGPDETPFRYLLTIFGSSIKSALAKNILKWLVGHGNLNTIIYGTSSERRELDLDIRLRRPKVSYISPNGMILPSPAGANERFNRDLVLLDQIERQKISYALQVMVSEDSPFHTYGLGLTVAKKSFSSLSPENRCDITEYTEVDFVNNRPFGVEMHGTDSKVYCLVGGEKY
jgi:hypothetical protein